MTGSSLTPPVILFRLDEPPGQDLTIFASEKAVREQMDVWVAREGNVAFDSLGRMLRWEFRNDTARSFFGGRLKVGGLEFVHPELAEETPLHADQLRLKLADWLVAHGDSPPPQAVADLIARCMELGAPVVADAVERKVNRPAPRRPGARPLLWAAVVAVIGVAALSAVTSFFSAYACSGGEEGRPPALSSRGQFCEQLWPPVHHAGESADFTVGLIIFFVPLIIVVIGAAASAIGRRRRVLSVAVIAAAAFAVTPWIVAGSLSRECHTRGRNVIGCDR